MKSDQKKRICFLAVLGFALLWLFVASIGFSSSLNKIQLEDSNQKYDEIAKANAATVSFAVERYLNSVAATAEFIEQYDDMTSPEAIDHLNDIAKDNDFTRLAIDIADGPGYTSDGFVVDTGRFHYGDRTRAGNPYVLDVVEAIVDQVPMVGFLVPMETEEGVYGAALRGSISTARLSEVFEETFVDAGGYFYVVDGQGRYVAKSQNAYGNFAENPSYFDALETVSFTSGYSLEAVKGFFANRERGISRYTVAGKERICYYEPTDVNGWMVMTVVPTDVIYASAKEHANNIAVYIAQLFSIFLIFVGYILITQRNERERTRLNEKCFKALSEHTNRVILEWDFETNHIVAMSNFQQLFGRKATTVNTAEDALSAKAVHEEDREAFGAVFKTISGGDPVNDARFRVMDQGGVYHWCSLSGLVIKDKKGRPFKAIGSLKNIENQLHRDEEMRQKAEQDQLTGLYNKAATEQHIRAALIDRRYKSNRFALMIIDVDNFKMVNDKLGHLYGDRVLSSLAEELKELFRTDDVIGRVGGDEFFILLQNYKDEEVLMKKAASVCDAFHKVYSGEASVVEISASIGIAIFPDHGEDYETLYRNADLALYDTKAKGKNGFTIYSGQQAQAFGAMTETTKMILDRRLKSFSTNPESYVFRLLYETRDTEAAITAVLRLAMETFGSSRAYIFEFNKDRTLLNNTYEWCSSGITPEIENLKDIPVASFAEGLYAMNKTGLFIVESVDQLPEGATKDILKPQGIKSMLHAAITAAGSVEGFIGFDDCENERAPTESELDIITAISGMIGTFLTRMRATEAEAQAKELLLDVLSNRNTMTYVIDTKTFEILYENTTIVDFVGERSLGKTCYGAFHNATEQCPKCPCRTLSHQSESCGKEMYNEKFGRNIYSFATHMQWLDQQKAFLVRCTIKE